MPSSRIPILSNQIYIINYLAEKIAGNLIKIHPNEYVRELFYIHYLKLVDARSVNVTCNRDRMQFENTWIKKIVIETGVMS